MSRLPDNFEFGSPEDLDQEQLIEVLKKMYREMARAINSKASIYQRKENGSPTDGQSSDTFLSIGDININTSTNKIEMLVEHTDPSTVVWKEI